MISLDSTPPFPFYGRDGDAGILRFIYLRFAPRIPNRLGGGNIKKASIPAFFLICLVTQGVLGADENTKAFQRGPVIQEKLKDGVYEGSHKRGPNKAVVKVTVRDGKLAEIEIVKHRAWKGKKAEPLIVQRIIEHQSTDVDSVSGATNSSRIIMNAVQKAREKAYQQ